MSNQADWQAPAAGSAPEAGTAGLLGTSPRQITCLIDLYVTQTITAEPRGVLAHGMAISLTEREKQSKAKQSKQQQQYVAAAVTAAASAVPNLQGWIYQQWPPG